MVQLGRVLEVDLSEGCRSFSRFSRETEQRFLGGRGLNARLLYRSVAPGTAPLGPDNVLLFSCGLLTGTPAPAASRVHVNALSPLTGILGSSNLGGDFGLRLRSCGIQTLIIRGKAPNPVYLFIDRDRFEIRDAGDFWGLETWAAMERFQQRLADNRPGIIAIGPAGENGALFACILNGRDHAAGRTGMGAVMGSKNLKAIVVRGQNPNRTGFLTAEQRVLVQQYLQRIVRAPEFRTLSRYGGAGYIKWADNMGILGTRNFRENRFAAVDCIDGKNLKKYVTRARGCHRCPLHCKADLEFNPGVRAVRPEFEPMIALGSKCGLSDLKTLVYLDNLCSRLGLDSISAGGAIAFAMDLYDRGLLTREDTGGIDLTWGNGASMEILIRQMAAGERLGAVLSRGVRNAAKTIGRGSEKYAFHVKGLELSGYHPMQLEATGLGYTVAARGGDFNDVYANLEYRSDAAAGGAGEIHAPNGKAEMVRTAMTASVLLDSLGLCKVPVLSVAGSFDLAPESALASAFTGRSITPAMLCEIGERIINVERLFNVRQGVTAADDALPASFFETRNGAPDNPGERQNWHEPLKQAFYRAMGWDARGRPSKKKLSALGLGPEDPPRHDPDGSRPDQHPAPHLTAERSVELS